MISKSEEKDLSFNDADSAPDMPKCRVVDPADFSEKDARPGTPWSRTIFYEAHVKGMTKLHPTIPKNLRGTFEGLAEQDIVQYVKSLGVSSIELLPVHYFPDDPHLLDNGLRNYWGYNTIGFFAPASRYYGPRGLPDFAIWSAPFTTPASKSSSTSSTITLPRATNLARPSPSRASTTSPYYRTLAGEPRYYINDTGTGNTVNTSHPRVLQMITDSCAIGQR